MATVRKSKKKIIIPICVVLVIAILSGTIFGVAKASKVPQVTLTEIGTGDIYEKVSATGEISAGTKKEYKVGSVATVKEVFVKVGDNVKKGDVLATFNLDNLNSEISSLQSSYNTALNSYNASLSTQSNAKKMVKQLDGQISALNKKIRKLEKQTNTTKKATTIATSKTTTKATTAPTTRITTTRTTTTTTTTTTKVSTTAGSPSESLSNIAESLKELNNTLAQITDDLNTLSQMMTIIADVVSQAMANGIFDSDVIAEKVGDALSQAMKEGIIESTNLIIESGLAVKMVEAAVSAIDFESIAAEIVNSKNVELSSCQIQLAALEGQRAVYKAQADGTLLATQKTAVESTKKALDVLLAQKAEMENGWVADFDGIITKVDVSEGGQTNLLSSGITLENLNSMCVTVSLSEYDIHKVKKGMTCDVTTAYGQYVGKVISIAPTATGGDESSILDNFGSMAGISGLSSLTASGAGVECVIRIDETDENIIAGFNANVDIQTGSYLSIPVVPIESIKLEKDGSYVYLYDDEEKTVTKTKIETGAVSDTAYQIKSGITVGDRIIKAPASDYEEDTFKVKIVK